MRPHRHHRAAATGALALAALLLASGCGSDSKNDDGDDEKGGGGSNPPSSPGVSAPATPSSGGGAPSTKAAGKSLSQDGLADALLTEAEMATGTDYERNVPDASILGGTETAVRPECQPVVDLFLPGNGKPAPAAGSRAATTRGTEEDPIAGSIDSIELYAFTAGEVEQLMTQGRAALATCKEIVTKDEQGVESTMTYTVTDSPAVGDESLAVHGLFEGGGATGAVVFRVGTHLGIVSVTDLEGTTPTLPDGGLVGRQVAKLETAVRG